MFGTFDREIRFQEICRQLFIAERYVRAAMRPSVDHDAQ